MILGKCARQAAKERAVHIAHGRAQIAKGDDAGAASTAGDSAA